MKRVIFFYFLASEIDVIDERFVNVVIIPEAERTPCNGV